MSFSHNFKTPRGSIDIIIYIYIYIYIHIYIYNQRLTIMLKVSLLTAFSDFNLPSKFSIEV